MPKKFCREFLELHLFLEFDDPGILWKGNVICDAPSARLLIVESPHDDVFRIKIKIKSFAKEKIILQGAIFSGFALV